jgi:hypothetical protein
MLKYTLRIEGSTEEIKKADKLKAKEILTVVWKEKDPHGQG